jgi:limonene-1,2-epoxide hydrolase
LISHTVASFVLAVGEEGWKQISQALIPNPDIIPEGAIVSITDDHRSNSLIQREESFQVLPMIAVQIATEGSDRGTVLHPLGPSRRLRAMQPMEQFQ